MRRLVSNLIAIPLVVWAVVTFTFLALRLIPGDPVLFRAAQKLTPEQIELFRSQWGLDQPVWKQYVVFLGQLVQGNLGQSTSNGQAVTALIAKSYPVTVEPAVLAAIFGLLLGVLVGVLAALSYG